MQVTRDNLVAELARIAADLADAARAVEHAAAALNELAGDLADVEVDSRLKHADDDFTPIPVDITDTLNDE